MTNIPIEFGLNPITSLFCPCSSLVIVHLSFLAPAHAALSPQPFLLHCWAWLPLFLHWWAWLPLFLGCWAWQPLFLHCWAWLPLLLLLLYFLFSRCTDTSLPHHSCFCSLSPLPCLDVSLCRTGCQVCNTISCKYCNCKKVHIFSEGGFIQPVPNLLLQLNLNTHKKINIYTVIREVPTSIWDGV